MKPLNPKVTLPQIEEMPLLGLVKNGLGAVFKLMYSFRKVVNPLCGTPAKIEKKILFFIKNTYRIVQYN